MKTAKYTLFSSGMWGELFSARQYNHDNAAQSFNESNYNIFLKNGRFFSYILHIFEVLIRHFIELFTIE